MASPFIPGARMAVVRGERVVNVRRIAKVYSNGNFVLEPLIGSPTDERPSQWRPAGLSDIAFQTGARFQVGASHLEPWTDDHARRLIAYRVELDVERRLQKIIACMHGRKDLTREVLAAMESALGIPVGAANE